MKRFKPTKGKKRTAKTVEKGLEAADKFGRDARPFKDGELSYEPDAPKKRKPIDLSER